MYLGQALTKLKNLKSKASRTAKYIDESAVHYEDQIPEYDYESEVIALRNLNESILKLKTAIQLTNATTKVSFRGSELSLAELILRNAQLRTDLAFAAEQMKHSISETGRYMSSRTKDEIKKVFAKGCDKTMFKAEIDRLEREKEELEAVLAEANASTPLIEG